MTTTLVLEPLTMALTRRQPTGKLLEHSDRGSQYASPTYQARLADQHIQVIMSRWGRSVT
jgi:putative transposase